MTDTSAVSRQGQGTAFLIGEVAGLDERLARDEHGLLAALAEVRSQVIKPALAGRSKRFADAPGDALLIHFEQAEDAMQCAAALQRLAGARNARIAGGGHDVAFRIGVGLLGSDGGDGDDPGLSRALGLMARCEPGGVVLSAGMVAALQTAGRLPPDTVGADGTAVLSPAALTLLPPPRPPRKTTNLWQAEAPERSIGPGTRLNETYEIDAAIGSGGMGEIFRGHEIYSDGTVAIKVIRAAMSGEEAVLALFQKEASVLKQIFDEAIVRYYAFSYDGALRRYYLAMEFVEGTPLSDMVKGQKLPREAVDALRRRVAGGLRVAHSRGIIHRDISPDNIIVPKEGLAHAKIIDFGIARSTAVGAGTIVGNGFVGKLGYASPEQFGLAGGEVTGRSDVYSFALVLAEASLGRRIDMGGGNLEFLDKRSTVPDLSGVDPVLRPLLESMLQPDPAHRPDMAAVERWAPGTALPGPAPRGGRAGALPPRSSTGQPPARLVTRTRAAVLALALLAGAGLGVFLALPHQTAEAPSGPEHPATDSPPRKAEPDKAALIRTVVADFNKGPCFFAQPVSIQPDAAGLDAFAHSREDFDRLDKAVEAAVGFSPDIAGHIVWSGQCPAIDFLQRASPDQAGAPKLFLRNTVAHSGQALAGSIEGGDGRSLSLLRVAEDGTVTDLTESLRQRGASWDFEVPLSHAGGGGPFPNLIVALSSPKPLALGAQPRPADQLFPEFARTEGADLRAAARMVLLAD